MPGQSGLEQLRIEWDDLASSDAFWAIKSERKKKHSRWTVEAFLDSGRAEVDEILASAARLGCPLNHDSALDFGCGAGRLSRHIAPHFREALGVDISERMISIAREINSDIPNLVFKVNVTPDLRELKSSSFDLVCSVIVLQHLDSSQRIEGYLAEYMRVLRVGGLLVFQLPTVAPRIRVLLARRHPYLALRRLGLSHQFLYGRLGLHPMRMTGMTAARVHGVIRQVGGRMLDVVRISRNNNMYYITR